MCDSSAINLIKGPVKMRTTSKVLMMYAIDTVMRNTAFQTRDTKTSIRWDSRSQCYGFAKIKLSKLRWFNFLLLTWFYVYCIHTSAWMRELYVLEFIDVERTMWEFVPGPACSPRTVSAISHQDISVSSNIFFLFIPYSCEFLPLMSIQAKILTEHWQSFSAKN